MTMSADKPPLSPLPPPTRAVEGGDFVLTHPEVEPVLPSHVGELLAHTREHAGLSINEVANRLRMSAKQIEAIERADYAKLPSGTFLRGFVRNYAKVVGLPPESALALLEQTHPDGVAVRATPVLAPAVESAPAAYQPRPEMLASAKARAVLAIFLVCCVAAVAWYWWEYVRPHRAVGGRAIEPVVQPAFMPKTSPVTTDAGRESVPTNAVAANEGNLSAAAAPAPLTTAGLASTPTPAPAAPTNALSPAKSAAAPVLAQSTQPTPAMAATSAPAATGTGTTVAPVTRERRAADVGVLGFTFNGESWVEVTDGSGRTVVSRRYKAGEAEEVAGRGPFSIVVGNAQATRMAYNGREFDLSPHTRATVARVTVK
jgi:cytoskeleton protein RodZ